ncbi:MAG: DnaT-like ssDNA-binding protein [Sphingobium sp.]
MTITFENSFATLAEATAFHSDRANTAWLAADTATKEAALIRASDYITDHYTFDVTLPNTLLTRATLVLAPFALTGPLVSEATPGIVREKADGIGEVQYSDQVVADRFPMISKILAPITGGGSSTFQSAKATL